MDSTCSITSKLCLACGICCNGVLFRDVELHPGDDARALESLGLPLERLRTKTRFAQPCAALCPDNRCRLYADRPHQCQAFECALFKKVAERQVELDAALRAIRRALRLADRVKQLLRELGDSDEALALARRFRRTKRRLEDRGADEASAACFAELSLAVHDLNLLLRREFYPESGD